MLQPLRAVKMNRKIRSLVACQPHRRALRLGRTDQLLDRKCTAITLL